MRRFILEMVVAVAIAAAATTKATKAVTARWMSAPPQQVL
jgi:hypothetical protein